MNIVIAGASGYIGQALIEQIFKKYPKAKIYALSRSTIESKHSNIYWQACDLFSIKSIEEAVPETIDCAIYLVHSMGPTATLDQGSFADYDLILADNFARVLKANQCKHLIYLGGLIPEKDHLSLHLESRQEVESVFKEYEVPLTIFRAGLIMGMKGSSFQIMLKLVQRLPIMLCPKWTQNLMSPTTVSDAVFAISDCIVNKSHFNKTYDLSSCQPLSYLDMMKQTATYLNKHKVFIPFPFLSIKLSRLWVSLITNSNKNLVYPLIESLKHKMLARKENLYPEISNNQKYSDSIKSIGLEQKVKKASFRYKPKRKTVRSVQRLPLPKEKTVRWSTQRYFEWISEVFNPWIQVKQLNGEYKLKLGLFKIDLLNLKFSEERSSPDRLLFYISGGVLVSKKDQGRIEFRAVLNNKHILAAIHNFRPALPWFVYVLTQAKVHAIIMHAFAKHLKKFN